MVAAAQLAARVDHQLAVLEVQQTQAEQMRRTQIQEVAVAARVVVHQAVGQQEGMAVLASSSLNTKCQRRQPYLPLNPRPSGLRLRVQSALTTSLLRGVVEVVVIIPVAAALVVSVLEPL